MRETTRNRRNEVINEFMTIIRSNNDYTVRHMYKEVGNKLFLSPGTVGNVVREHYKDIVTEEMIQFVKDNKQKESYYFVSSFSAEFNVCIREARYIIQFCKEDKNVSKEK